MKRAVKRTSITIGIILMLIIVLSGTYMYMMNSEIKKMTPVETGRILDNVTAIQDSFTNIYLIEDSTSYIVIDAGNDIDVIEKELTKSGIDPKEVFAVLLTHTDADHVAALSLFNNAQVYLASEEEKLITGEKSRFLFIGNSIDTDDYILLDDKQEITIGNTKVLCILTPGHTPGSMCYLVNDSLLFTGDAISLKSGKMDKFNDFFNMDTEKSINSFINITNLPDAKYIFTAHYGITDNYDKAVESWK